MVELWDRLRIAILQHPLEAVPYPHPEVHPRQLTFDIPHCLEDDQNHGMGWDGRPKWIESDGK